MQTEIYELGLHQVQKSEENKNAYGVKFTHVSKSVHMRQFAYVSKFSHMQINTPMSKSVPVYRA